jgi:hypothetical protein
MASARFDTPMLAHVTQHHLLVLNRGEPGLPGVGSLVRHGAVVSAPIAPGKFSEFAGINSVIRPLTAEAVTVEKSDLYSQINV